jgi:hypothetical protein
MLSSDHFIKHIQCRSEINVLHNIYEKCLWKYLFLVVPIRKSNTSLCILAVVPNFTTYNTVKDGCFLSQPTICCVQETNGKLAFSSKFQKAKPWAMLLHWRYCLSVIPSKSHGDVTQSHLQSLNVLDFKKNRQKERKKRMLFNHIFH